MRLTRTSLASPAAVAVGISSGVDAGDKVIVRGGERLSPDQAVEIISAPDAK